MYNVTVNKSIFEITPGSDRFDVNGNEVKWDFTKISDQYFHIIYDHRSYRAEVVSSDYAAKEFIIKVNGHNYPVTIKGKLDMLLEKMGMNTGTSAKINPIKAPMPGLIIDLQVKTGDEVKTGQPLLVLEAMKMENIIKSPGYGMVKNVKVEKGNSVEKGQILIEF